VRENGRFAFGGKIDSEHWAAEVSFYVILGIAAETERPADKTGVPG